MVQPVDRLYVHCGELISLTDGPERGLRRGGDLRRLGLIEDGALAVDRGRIVATGTTADIRAAYRAPRVLDLSGFVVLPGLVDAHTHALGVRGAVRGDAATTLEQAAARQLTAFAAAGTTAVEIKSGSGFEPAAARQSLAALAAAAERAPVHTHRTLLVADPVGTAPGRDSGGSVDTALGQTLPDLVSRQLCDACDVHVTPGGLGLQDARRMLAAAAEHGLRRRMLADPVPMGAAEVGLELGVVVLAHLAGLSVGAMERLAGAEVAAVLLPSGTTGVRRHPPARQMIDAGCAVALSSNFDPGAVGVPRSMVSVIGLARANLRMSIAECLHAATINAACALGMDGEIGTLHPGKRADFVALELSSHEQIGAVLDGAPAPLVVIGGEPVAVHVRDLAPDV